MDKGQNIIVEKDDVNCRLSTWIIRNNKPLNFNSVNTLCRKGLIRINGLKAKSSYRLVIGDVITMPNLSLHVSGNRPLPKTDPKLSRLLVDSIIFKDKYLIAINKPEGLASQGGSRQGDRHVDAKPSGLLMAMRYLSLKIIESTNNLDSLGSVFGSGLLPETWSERLGIVITSPITSL
jgi:23S rRNA pseudouridine955/2504/2580 synthase